MKYNDQKGAALIEFALIAPLLFVILFGIVEMSLLFYNKAVITNASREGARSGIVFNDPRFTKAEIEAIVNNYAAAHLITFDPAKPNPTTTIVPVDTTSAASGDSLTVTVSYPYTFLVFHGVIKLLGNNSWPTPLTLRAITVMRYE